MSGVAPGGFFKLPESGRINKGAVGSRYSNIEYSVTALMLVQLAMRLGIKILKWYNSDKSIVSSGVQPFLVGFELFWPSI